MVNFWPLTNGAKTGVNLWVLIYGCKLRAQKRVLINVHFYIANLWSICGCKIKLQKDVLINGPKMHVN